MNLPIKLDLPLKFFDEEERCGFVVSSEMKNIWAVELDLSNELLKVCKENNLKIFADGGTMLGAVRHSGFIPWDDDIDFVMFREDYEKLCSIAGEKFKDPYFFQTEYTDSGSMRGHAQLRNSLTTGILQSDLNCKCKFNQGIFIDIFPLDSLKSESTNTVFLIKLRLFRSFLYYYTKINYLYVNNTNELKLLIAKILHLFTNEKTERFLFKKYEKLEQKYNNKNCRYVSKLFFREVKENMIWEKEWFNETDSLKFEVLNIPVSNNYDAIMKKFFGNWRVPKRETSTHGDTIFDASKSYKEYIDLNGGENK